MKFRFAVTVLLFATTLYGAAPKPKPIAPDSIPHTNALFLASLSNSGTRRVSFKASAIGTHFFLEEPAGVTVYVYDGIGYRREKFMKGTTLEKAIRTYTKAAKK